jgi:hypothetical protein
MGTTPNTRAALSSKVKIYGYSVAMENGFKQIGCLSEFGTDESRTIDPVRGIGYGDQIAELVPSVTEPMTITANKTLLYASNLFQIFGYKGGIDGIARSLKHHRWPFDIKEEIVFSEIASRDDVLGATNARPARSVDSVTNSTVFNHEVPQPITAVKALFTFFEGCWMNSYSKSQSSDTAMITENSSITVSDIVDGISQYGEYIDTGLAPTQTNGAAGNGYSVRFAGGSQRAGGAPTAQ